MSARAPIPLVEIDGELGSIRYGEESFDALWFHCPECGNHSCVMPYSAAGGRTKLGHPVWRHQDGNTVETITLTPSYLVRQPCGLHCWIRGGVLHFC